jgi:hypothetical protein
MFARHSKVFLFILLAAIIVVSMTGCIFAGDSASPTATDQSQDQAQDPSSDQSSSDELSDEPLVRGEGFSVYNDSLTGASFVVPDAWNLQLLKDRTDGAQLVLYPKGTATELGTWIYYSSWDLYDRITEEQKAEGATRNNFHGDSMDDYPTGDALLSYFQNKQDWVEGGAKIKSAERITINGKEFFLYKGTTTTTKDGAEVNIDYAVIAHVERGYWYQLAYNTVENSLPSEAIGGSGGNWQTFRSLIASIQYP